jgi:hypothetical protein
VLNVHDPLVHATSSFFLFSDRSAHSDGEKALTLARRGGL